jgi:hypothetical protein
LVVDWSVSCHLGRKNESLYISWRVDFIIVPSSIWTFFFGMLFNMDPLGFKFSQCPMWWRKILVDEKIIMFLPIFIFKRLEKKQFAIQLTKWMNNISEINEWMNSSQMKWKNEWIKFMKWINRSMNENGWTNLWMNYKSKNDGWKLKLMS